MPISSSVAMVLVYTRTLHGHNGDCVTMQKCVNQFTGATVISEMYALLCSREVTSDFHSVLGCYVEVWMNVLNNITEVLT